MNLTLGLSLGFGSTACQKTGKSSEDLATSKTASDTPVQPDWAHVLQEPDWAHVLQKPDKPTLSDDHELPPERKPLTHQPPAEPAAKIGEVKRRDPCPGCGMG